MLVYHGSNAIVEKPMTQENVYSIISMLTPSILQRLMDGRNISDTEAANLLYHSELYRKLEIEETKLWHLSSLLLYDLLEEELTTGKITWPEEQ